MTMNKLPIPGTEAQAESQAYWHADYAVITNLPYATITASALFALLASQYKVACVFYLLPIVALPWLLYLACVTIRRPMLIGLQILKILIWTGGICLASEIQVHKFISARNDALRVSSAVDAYMAAKGACPEHIEDLGIEMTAARKDYRLAHFDCYDGKPNLWYFSTFTAFDMEEYDFETHRWYHSEVDLP